jgi:mRNA interferase RelE/StbE
MGAYRIILKRSAIADLDAMRKYDATQVADAIERYLLHHPTRESQSRIKRLRGIDDPDYRLRVGDYRVFYVVDEAARQVDVLRVMHKNKTAFYYKELKS